MFLKITMYHLHLRVRLLHRERVPLCSMEEGRAESHELGDHRALLQQQRYETTLSVNLTHV